MTSVRDIIVIAVLLFAIGIATIIIVQVSHSINSQLLTVSTFNDSADARNVINRADIALNSTDYMYLAAFVGFFFAIIITGYFVGGLPIVAPIYFFIVVIFTFVSVILQNAYLDANSAYAFTVSNLPITNFILQHLGYFMAIFGLAGILVMFAKPQVNY